MSEPIGAVDQAAITVHEFYTACKRAGFTDEQAFELAKVFLAENVRST
jgi:hypothetical protein